MSTSLHSPCESHRFSSRANAYGVSSAGAFGRYRPLESKRFVALLLSFHLAASLLVYFFVVQPSKMKTNSSSPRGVFERNSNSN